MEGFQREVFHPSRPPLAGTPHGITPPTQWDRSHVSMIHNVRRGKRWMLTRTKFFCRMPGDGKQLLVLLTCSGAMIIAMSSPFRLGSVFFRRTLDRPSCNELDVIKFEHVHAVSRLPCHDTPRLLRSGLDSNFHRRRREEIYHRLRDDSAEGREAASTTPSRQPSSMVPTPTSAENGEIIDSDTTTPREVTQRARQHQDSRLQAQVSQRPHHGAGNRETIDSGASAPREEMPRARQHPDNRP